MKPQIALLLTLSLTSAALAQDQSAPPAPRVATKYPVGPAVSRVDIYGLYSYIHPVNSDINNQKYLPINPGAVAGISGFFTPHFGLQAEGSFFPHGPNDCIYGAQAGPVARIQKGRFVPFVHLLGGAAKVGGPVFQPCSWGYGVTAGLGMDYILPYFNDHLAIRPIQADYDYSHVDYGPLITPADVSGGLGVINAYKLSAGMVLRLGNMTPPPPVVLTCSTQPASGFVGDPFTVTASPDNLDPRKPATYTWSTTGGQIAGTGTSAPVTTKGIAPGTYNVTAHVTQGVKPYQSATCTSSFAVRDYDPPTLTCSASPSSVISGMPSTITSVGNSPQNRALSYSFAATAGQLSGSGASMSLDTSGLPPTTINVTCNVVDDLGKSATATTFVTVTALPAVPPVPQPLGLCSVTFERDHKRPNRVDNESKACLDDIALSLQRQADAHLAIVGNHAPEESDRNAAERADNVRLYLTREKGIDPARIDIYTGTGGARSVENILLPAGATLPTTGHTPLDLTTVKHEAPAAKVTRRKR